MAPDGIRVDVPGREPLHVTDVVLDFTGTLSLDGSLLPGVAEAVTALAQRARVHVMTADTMGTARAALRGLPVEVLLVSDGADKLARGREIGLGRIAAIGNGRNDVPLVREAALGIAVVGPEGAAGELVRAAGVVARDVLDAIGLLLHPLRIKATLRE
jgi:soluble P-type ATPase